jgi:hypothetical protein
MVTGKESLQTYRQLVGIPSPHYLTNLTTPATRRESRLEHITSVQDDSYEKNKNDPSLVCFPIILSITY